MTSQGLFMFVALLWVLFSGCGPNPRVETVEKMNGGLVSEEAPVGVRGFVNMGNTCYFNSILQVILHSKHVYTEYRDFIPKSNNLGDTLHNELVLLFRRLWDTSPAYRSIPINPIRAWNVLKRIDVDFFVNDMQQDAHEALMKILGVLASTNSTLPRLFQFAVSPFVLCPGCPQIPRIRFTPENQIMIPIADTGDIISLSNAIGKRFGRESVDGFTYDYNSPEATAGRRSEV
jgi:uncharacterized UBP type Zn finger protein